MRKSNNLKRLTELGKIEKVDITLLIIIIVYLPLLLFILDNKVLLCIFIFGWLAINELLLKRYNKLKKVPFLYSALKWLSLVTIADLILITISFYFNFDIGKFFGLLLFTYLYLSITLIFLYYIVDSFYILILKKIFPEERDKKLRYKLSLKELSKFIDLSDQKKYLNIVILETFVYFIISVYFMCLFFKLDSVTNDTSLIIINEWAERKDYLTVFNGVSLLSIIFALYTITFPWKKKIISEAKKDYKKY